MKVDYVRAYALDGEEIAKAGDDTILGSAAPETLEGGGGNDLVLGFAGYDLLRGGAGDDRLRDRRSGVLGQSVSVRVEVGGRGIIIKTKEQAGSIKKKHKK